MEKKPNDEEKIWEKKGKGCEMKKGSNDETGQIDEVIGHFGKYQLLIFMFKILIGATSAFNNLAVTFYAPSDFVSYWCADVPASVAANELAYSTSQPPLTNSLYPLANTINFAVSGEQNENLLPIKATTLLATNHTLDTRSTPTSGSIEQSYQDILGQFMSSSERNARHSMQLSYDTPRKIRKECTYLSPADNKVHKCSSYRYDTGIWISTIIDEWDLVCDRAWFVSLSQSLYMAGFIVSFLVFGYISDRFGRWRSLVFGAMIEILSGFGCSLSNSVSVFMLFRFLLGFGNAGRSSSSYLIMIEWCGPKWRMHISTLGSLGWILGYCSMPWITGYFLHFRHMQLFVCFYELVFVVWLLGLPESPRWLLTHRRFEEAYDVLLMAAKFNRLIRKQEPGEKLSEDVISYPLDLSEKPAILVEQPCAKQLESASGDEESSSSMESSQSLKPYTIDEFNSKFKRLVNTIQAKEFTKNEDNLSIFDLFKWKNLRFYALILFFVWAANSFIYYGIALGVGSFGGRNLFIAFTVAGITELPSMAFTIICMKFLPRKTTNLFIFVTTGLLCAVQVPLRYYDYQWLQQSTIMLAKLFNSCSFTCILYQTMELFPTSIRQTAYSGCCLAGRIGSILAPFIKELAQHTNDSVPPVMYAILSFTAALFIQNLPETKGTDLPDTLLEAENFKEKQAETVEEVVCKEK